MSAVISRGPHLQEEHTVEAVPIFVAAAHNKIATPTVASFGFLFVSLDWSPYLSNYSSAGIAHSLITLRSCLDFEKAL